MVRVTSRALALAVTVFGLGCVGDASNQQQQDAGTGGDAALDSSNPKDAAADVAPDVPSAPCDLTKNFGAPTLVAGVNGASNEGGAQLSPDELTIYFHSDRAGGLGDYDLYFATRASVNDSFANVLPVPNVNTAYTESFPSITNNGLTLFYEARAGSIQAVVSDLWVATRGSTAVAFSNPQVVPKVNSGTRDGQPFTRDGASLYFMSQNPDNYKKVFHAQGSNGTFADPTVVAELTAIPNDAQSPVVSADELSIYWASNRPAPVGLGSSDILVATRSSKSAAFGSITNVSVLNSSAADLPSWLSTDGCRLYLSSDRSGNSEIYVATRPN